METPRGDMRFSITTPAPHIIERFRSRNVLAVDKDMKVIVCDNGKPTHDAVYMSTTGNWNVSLFCNGEPYALTCHMQHLRRINLRTREVQALPTPLHIDQILGAHCCPQTGAVAVIARHGLHLYVYVIFPSWCGYNSFLLSGCSRPNPCRSEPCGLSFLSDGTLNVILDHIPECPLYRGAEDRQVFKLKSMTISNYNQNGRLLSEGTHYQGAGDWMAMGSNHMLSFIDCDNHVMVHDTRGRLVSKLRLPSNIKSVYSIGGGNSYLVSFGEIMEFCVIAPHDRGTMALAMAVLCSDDYLIPVEPGIDATDKEKNTAKFFGITARLPYELQMVVCNKLREPGLGDRKYISKEEMDPCFMAILGSKSQ